MMRHHHRHEIGIDVAGWIHRHVGHHSFHGCFVLGEKRSFRGDLGAGRPANVRTQLRKQLGGSNDGSSEDAHDREREHHWRSETASERIHPSPPDHVHSERRATLARQAFGQEVLRDPTLRISGTNSCGDGIERSRPYFNLLSAPNVRYGIKAPDHHALRVQGVPAFPPKASKSCSESERFGCRERAVSPRTIEWDPRTILAFGDFSLSSARG